MKQVDVESTLTKVGEFVESHEQLVVSLKQAFDQLAVRKPIIAADAAVVTQEIEFLMVSVRVEF